MTLGTAPSDLQTVDALLLQAYRFASLVPIEHGELSPEQTGHGRIVLGNILDELASYGASAWVLDFEEVTLTADEETYSLSSSTLVPVDAGSYIAASETDTNQTTGETPVLPISAAQWNALSAKSATGNPKLYWADRSANPVQVRVWPVPTEAGTIRFLVQRHLGKVSDGSVNPDLNRFWNRWMVYAVAFDLAVASAMDPVKLSPLRSERDRSLRQALEHAYPHEPTQIVLEHPVGWGSY